MRLTVGPLPAAIYWRRRGVVLVGLAMVVLVVSYACGGPSTSNAGAQGSSPSPHFATATAGGSVLTSTPAHPTATTPPPPTAFSLATATGPTVGATTGSAAGPCADDEIELIASADSPQPPRKAQVEVTIKIKNISARTCSRDVGADAQELRLQQAAEIVWSSDDCNPRHGTDVRSFAPGQVASFTLAWSGNRSRTGTGAVNCAAGPPDVGTYDLIPRLDRKVGPAFALRIS